MSGDVQVEVARHCELVLRPGTRVTCWTGSLPGCADTNRTS